VPRFASRGLFGLLLLWGLSALLSCEGTGAYTRLAPGTGVTGSGGATEDAASPVPANDAGAGADQAVDAGTPGGAGQSGAATGGMGVTATGGRSATGGASGGAGGPGQAAGGTPGQGGTSNGTGGVKPGSGGATGTGGSAGRPGTGGSTSSGGATATGGTPASGGTPGTGAGGRAGSGGATGGSAGGGAGGGGRAGAAGGSGPVQRILSLDFVGGVSAGGAGGVSGTVPMGPTEVAGVKAAPNWNEAPGPAGSLSALVLSDGTPATGAAVTWNAPTYATGPGVYAIGYPDMPGDVRMLNGYLDPSWSAPPGAPVTVVTFSGLPTTVTSGGYDVYVYVLGSLTTATTRGFNYTIGSKTIRVTETGPLSTSPASPYPYVQAPDGGSGTYVVFHGLTGSGFALQVKPDSTGNVFRSPINGIQIVWPAGS